LKTVSVKFKTEEAAQRFVVSLGGLGEDTEASVNGTSAVVRSENPRMIMYIQHLAKDIGESASCRGYAKRLLAAINESISTNSSARMALMDGTEVRVTPKQARLLAAVHDGLLGENQVPFLVFASESKNTYQNAADFAASFERD
jgi:hypothetical protein